MQPKPHFLCVLQTHSTSENQTGYKRYTGTNKAEIVRRCVASLVASMKRAQDELYECEFELVVLDDHSDEETVVHLKRLLGRAGFKTSFISLLTYGIMPSILACYEYGLKHGRDMVYFAQDDYLFDDDAISEMIKFYNYASESLGQTVSIYPFDDPYRYQPQNNFELVRIVHGHKRHWRTLYNCASCFMTHHSVIAKHWDLFYKMGTSEVSTTMERDSINRLWQERGYTLFCPIPSLALHMQYGSEKDPFIDWRKWWDKFAPEKDLPDYPLEPGKKIIVNVGTGKSKLDIPLIKNGSWQEVRVDTDPDASPHLIGSMDSMPALPPHCADAVYGSHVLEHVYWHQIPAVIREIKRILKPSGMLILLVPDMEAAAQKIVEGDIIDTIYESPSGAITPLDMLYGYRKFTAAGMKGMEHKTGFTAGVLEKVLRDLGFSYVLCKKSAFNIIAFASDSPIDESSLGSIV